MTDHESMSGSRRRASGEQFTMLRRAWRYGHTRAGLVLLVLVVLMAVVGPAFAPYSPTEFVGRPFAPPGQGALLGTDSLGHDVWTRVLYGGRTVLWTSMAATVIGMVLGTTLGLYAGFVRGSVDGLLMRSLDVVLAFPQLVLVLLFVSMLGTHLWLIVLLSGVAIAPGVARVTRGMTMDLATRDFVRSAELLGLGRTRLLFGEVLPGLTSPLLVEATMRLMWSIGLIAGVSFLGFGVQAPAADWGLMINENRNGFSLQPWAVLGPVTMLGLLASGSGLLAEGLSRALALVSSGEKNP
jgi:peptide/nickel transport system permease protein